MSVRKIFDVPGFQVGYFILAALSFNSLTAGQRWMSFFTLFILCWGAVLLLVRIRYLREFRKVPCIAGVLLFLISYAISSIWNSSYGITGNLKAMAWMTLEFFLLYAGSPEEKEPGPDSGKGIFLAVTGYTAIQSVISLAMLCVGYQGAAIERGMYLGLQEGRLWGSYSDPNYGAVLAAAALALSLGAVLFTEYGRRYRKLLWIHILLQYLYLVFSYSRTGWIGFSISMIVHYMFWLREEKPAQTFRVAALILLLLALFGGTPIRNVYNSWQQGRNVYAAAVEEPMAEEDNIAETSEAKAKVSEKPEHQNAEKPELQDAESEETAKAPLHREEELGEDISNGRFEVWENGIELWQTSPLVGISYRNISAYAAANLPDCYILGKEVALNTFHNMFVDVLVSQGAVGICILAGILMAMLRLSIHGCRNLTGAKRREVVQIGASLLPILIGALFLSDILYINSPSSVLFWILLGNWCRLVRIPAGENDDE